MSQGCNKYAAVVAVILASGCSSSSTPISQGSTTTTRVAATTTTKVVMQDQRPFSVGLVVNTFVDTSRTTGMPGDPWYAPNRTLVTDVRYPKGDGRHPLVILAHGNDGNPGKFSELLTKWAQAGYIAAAPRFPSTTDRPETYNFADYVNQPADVSFVIGQLLNSDLKDRIDADRIGVAGLSLGGGTVYGLAYNPCCFDARIKSAIVFDGFRFPFDTEFTVNSIPVIIFHGDADPVLPYAQAKKSYEQSAQPKWFVTLVGGSHSSAFEDAPSPHDDIVEQVTVDFWDLTLLNDRGGAALIEQHGSVPKLATVESE